MGVFGNNNQIVLTTTDLGASIRIDLTPNLADTGADYAPGVAGPSRLKVPGTYTQEDRRLAPDVIKAVEEEVALALTTKDTVLMFVNQDILPKWDNQLETVFLNAARARISTHRFVGTPTGVGNRKLSVELLP
jgi:hypothetical protein